MIPELTHQIPDPLDYAGDEYEAYHYLALPRAQELSTHEPPTSTVLPKEHVQLVKRTAVYPYVLWAPETVHYQFMGTDCEAPYWKFTDEPMRTAIIDLVAAQERPPASSHPAMAVAIGDLYGKTFYLTMKTTVHWWAITGWVEKSEVAAFDATH